MAPAQNRRALALNALLAAVAAFIPFSFYNFGLRYAALQKVLYLFKGLAWHTVGLNLLLGIPFLIFAGRTLKRAGSRRKTFRLVITVLAIICFIYILRIIFVLATWSINGFAP